MSCLDDMELSCAQREAVVDQSARVLVAAGAGSGKTSLLVAYFLHALLDENVPIERLVAVTFTRKAAGELTDRIRTGLENRGRFDLARSLDAGTIGTIHSLCRRILRQNALDAGVDPAFAVLEADAAQLLEREAARQVWEEAVQAADEQELAVLAQNEKTLRAELVPLYDRLRSVGCETPRLHVAAPHSSAAAWPRLEDRLRSALDAGLALNRRTATMEKALDMMQDCLQWASAVDAKHPTLEDLARSSRFFPTRIAALEDHFQPVRKALTECRHSLARPLLAQLVGVMNDLLSRFHERYGGLKRQRGVLDFADLELLTRAFLCAARPECLPIFGVGSRVMIDEFQDTNELQCSVLESLGADSILMVGDERQSIYRFRGADVEVFARRRDALVSADAVAPDDAQTCSLHRLDRNYRSREEVLTFINHLFSQEGFFGSGFVALECGTADRDDLFSRAAIGDPAEHPTVEVLAVERGDGQEPSAPRLSIQEAEARACARFVEHLLRVEGREPRDVVILSPALTYAELYQEALRALNLPAYVVRGKGYYSREEIADVRCLLQLLVNPHDDLALVTVLRSPLVGLSDDAVFLLGRRSRRSKATSLWQTAGEGHLAGLPVEDTPLLGELLTRLSILRRRVGRPGLASLIDEAITDLGYDLCVLHSEEGKRRFANIRKLMRLADEFEALHGPDLAAFVDVLATMEDVGDQEGSAATLAEEENVIRVMTVHQAKGLEFPIVVLTGLGSDVRGGSHPTFVVDNQRRVGVFLKGSGRDTYEEHDLCWGPATHIIEEEKKKERQEDLRLMYVAMTRAKERLALVGAGSDDGGLDSSRLGRIVGSLGLGSLPGPGERVPLPEVHALVRGVSYEEVTTLPVAAETAAEGPAAEESASPAGEPLSAPDPAPAAEVPERFITQAVPLVPTPSRISFSGLTQYLDCPRRFYLERVLGLRLDLADHGGLVEEEPGAGGRAEGLVDGAEAGTGREVGLLVHALLERSVLHGPKPSPVALRALAMELVSGVVADAGADGSRSGSAAVARCLPPAQLARAVSLAGSFWSSPVAQRAGLEGALKEASFSFLEGDLLISGILDLVWEEEGRVFIVDYKTNALKGRKPEEVAGSYRLQATLYALAALRAGAREVQMHFLFLEQAEAPVTFSYGQEDVARLEHSLVETLRPLRAGQYPVRQSPACAECRLTRVCEGLR